MGNETTTKFKVDISELKKGIQEANRQIKLANAEFKAAAAGMDDWQKSTDGVQKKIDQLESVLGSQKSILESYKRQLELVSAEFGENSREADEMRIKIANQQAVVNTTERSIRDYTARLGDLQREEQEAARAADEQSSALGELTKKIDDQKKELEQLKTQYSNVVLEQGASSEEAQRLAGQIENLSGDLQNNENRLREATDAANDFDRSLDNVDDGANEVSNGGISAFGIALGNLVSNIVQNAINKLKELATETINVGASFEAGMSKVEAVSGASGEELEALREKAKEMGATTVFSATEATEAMNYMAMAGWKTEDMLDGISGIMDLAAASGEELGTTSDIVTDALTAFGLEAKDAGHFSDVLAAASSNANTNVGMLGESFKFAAPIAGAMGASVEDVSLALGLMANSGIKSAMAGNTLKGAITSLMKPTKEQAEAMQKLGFITTEAVQKIDFEKVEKAEKNVQTATLNLDTAQVKLNEAISNFGADSSQAQIASNNLEKAQLSLAAAEQSLEKEQAGVSEEIAGANTLMMDSEGNMRSLGDIISVLREKMGKVNVELTDGEGNAKEYDEIIGDLTKTTEGLAQAEQLNAAAAIFGKKNMTGILAIINASEKDYNNLSDAIYNCEGKAKDMADIMSNNLAGDMKLLSSQVESVQIAIFEKLAPALRSGTELLGKLLDGVMFVVDHSDEFITAITSIAAGVAAYLAYTTAVTVMTEGWAALTIVTKAQAAAQAVLNAVMSANPIGLVIAAIVALVTAFILLWNKSEKFRNFWIGLWESIQEVAIKDIEAIVKFATGMWEGLKTGAHDAWEGIKKAFSNVSDWFKDVFSKAWQKVKDVFSTGGKIFTGIKDGIVNAFKAVVNAIIRGINAVIAVPFNAINDILDKIQNTSILGFQPFEDLFFRLNVPQIPELSRGGILKKGQVGLLEGNGSEAVVPLERNKEWIAATAAELKNALIAEGVLGSASGSGGIVTNYNFVQNNTSPKALSRLDIYRQSRNLFMTGVT